MMLLIVAALIVSTSGILASATSDASTNTPSCVVQEETALDAGILNQPDRLAEQHAQETGSSQNGPVRTNCGQ